MSDNLPAHIQHPEQPFQRMLTAQGGANVGAIAIEQERAVAEAQGQLTLAKRFPRSMTGAMTEFLETCKSPDFAATAFYSVPNRGSGPSIRFAEEAARCYGNFQYGHRELSRTEGKSEIEVYAWDMQNNNYSKRQITVMHVMDTRNGPKKLTDQADIDNKIANVASKQMRGRILALLPKHLVAAGQAACKVTLAGGNAEKPLSDRIVAMVQAFGRFGVNKVHLETHLGHSVDNTTVDELADLMGIFNAIKEGGKASEYFPLGEAAESTAAATAAAITQQAKQAAATTTKATRSTAKPAAEKPAQQEQQQAAAQDSKPAQSDSSAVKDSDAGITEKPAASQADAAATKPQAQAAANNPDDDVF